MFQGMSGVSRQNRNLPALQGRGGGGAAYISGLTQLNIDTAMDKPLTSARRNRVLLTLWTSRFWKFMSCKRRRIEIRENAVLHAI